MTLTSDKHTHKLYSFAFLTIISIIFHSHFNFPLPRKFTQYALLACGGSNVYTPYTLHKYVVCYTRARCAFAVLLLLYAPHRNNTPDARTRTHAVTAAAKPIACRPTNDRCSAYTRARLPAARALVAMRKRRARRRHSHFIRLRSWSVGFVGGVVVRRENVLLLYTHTHAVFAVVPLYFRCLCVNTVFSVFLLRFLQIRVFV